VLSTPDFFAAFAAAGFLKTATWTPTAGAGGGPQQTAKVQFKAPSQDVLGGSVFVNEYHIIYPATAFFGMRRGETVNVDGTNYKVREDPHSELDGSRLMIPLEPA
jgi:hypothetical protein